MSETQVMQKPKRGKEEQLARYKSMGVPIPLKSIAHQTSISPNASPDKVNLLEQIRAGNFKGQFDGIIDNSASNAPASFAPMRNPGSGEKLTKNAPQVQSHTPQGGVADAEAKALEAQLYGTSSAGPVPPAPPIDGLAAGYGDNVPVTNISAKLRQNMAAVAQPVLHPPTPTQVSYQGNGTTMMQQPVPQLGQMMNEEELDKRIRTIAAKVSKTIITKFLTESSKKGSGIIIESKTVRKAEIVGKNKVKIGGKYYKLTPLTASSE